MALALTTRRSTAAAIASALAAMALAAAVAGRSCRVSQPGPDAAVRDMIQAAKGGDLDAVYELFGPDTQAAFGEEAKHSTALVGASMRFMPKEMLSINTSDDVPTPTDITTIEEHGDTATVEIVSAAGRSQLHLVRVKGRWHIEAPHYVPGAPL